jgi:hypothetical protein
VDFGGYGVAGEVLDEATMVVWRERVGVEEDAKRYLHPGTLLYRLTAGGRNSGPRGGISGPQNFRVK